MPTNVINTEAEKDSYIQVWKYLSANGKLMIPVHDGLESSSVYTEEDLELKKKTVRVFMDAQAIDLYINGESKNPVNLMAGELRVGIAPVKILQTQLSEIYGNVPSDDFTVECILTSYDELGNMQDVDTIWTQTRN